MKATIYNIIDSIARYLQLEFSDIPIYAGENQQGTDYPCFFIMLTNPQMSKQMSGTWLRDIGLDVVYVQKRNELNSNLKLYTVQEWLDVHMGMIPLTDGTDTAQVHTYEREASVQDQDLHYKFHMKIRVFVPEPQEVMRELEGMNVRQREKNAG